MEESSISMDVDKLEMYASQTAVHTILLSLDYWRSYQKSQTDIPLFNHYIVCNETEDVLRFGQVGSFVVS